MPSALSGRPSLAGALPWLPSRPWREIVAVLPGFFRNLYMELCRYVLVGKLKRIEEFLNALGIERLTHCFHLKNNQSLSISD